MLFRSSSIARQVSTKKPLKISGLKRGEGAGIACAPAWATPAIPAGRPTEQFVPGAARPGIFVCSAFVSKLTRCTNKNAPLLSGARHESFCGGEGIRTPVQTYSPKAFYMLIPALIVGKQQGLDKPIVSLAEWS